MKIKNIKISILQIIRLTVQIIMFIILPALFINALNGVKAIYQAMITMDFNVSLLPSVVELIVLIPVTILFGRFFCGWMCGFGSFTDFIYKISGKVMKKSFKRKIKINRKADAVLKYLKYVILAILVIFAWTLDLSVINKISPWDVFGMTAIVGNVPAFDFVLKNLPIATVLFVLIIIASIFIERFFCRYLCPMGAIFALASFLRIGKIRKPTEKCGKCRICTNNCAMGIPLYEMEEVKSVECINCMQCVSVCPRGNTTYAVAKKDVQPLIISAVSVAVMTGSYYTVYNAAAGIAGTTGASVEQQLSLYKDGTYTGTGTGFRGQITVSVVVSGGKITKITTVSSKDDAKYFDRAFSSITKNIISDQSSEVDTVSGATFSSRGIISAVSNALKTAENSTSASTNSESSSTVTGNTTSTAANGTTTGTSSTTTATTATTATSGTTSGTTSGNSSGTTTTTAAPTTAATTAPTTAAATVASTGQYKDGTYTGTGSGFRGTVSISVVVSGGAITSITTVSSKDDAKYYDRAFSTITKNIISTQSSSVSTVSGATFSSNGIINAVKSALSTAKN